ncbi:MAG TPA: S53 family peptidase [Terriglobales bacterium]|jgi:subtilase family serine protease|nr:S53 family peptidase [Terriglobales bacterium]
MIRKFSTSLLTIIALLSVASIAGAESLPLLTRHVREATRNGQARLVGHLPANQSMRLDIVLPMHNQAGLTNLLNELYNPSSPSYRQFLTVQEFTAKFGPTQDDYDSVIRFATSNGFTVVGGTRDAMDVQLKGSVASIETAFHVTLGVYQHPTENRTFYAVDREPTLDLPFQLWHISGLDNYSIPRPALEHRIAKNSKATTGSCPQQSFCGSDMRAAYYGGTTLTGAGQNIGLLEYAGFDIADVNTYYQNAGQTRTAAVTGISTDGTPLSCLINQGCDDTEQTIDITQALGMAPGTTTVYMYVGSSDTALLGAMSSDIPLPAQLSASWIWDPSDPGTDDPYFQKMAAQGQNYFQASGDDGKFNSGYPTWPCDSAYVTSVGGTDLETTGPGGAWKSETAWSDGGGGFWAADDIPIPAWQKKTAAGCSSCSQTYRNAPDVSANANFTFYVCADQSGCSANEYGGTSFAAPMWAGYLALLNQKRASHGLKSIGFINPAIYAAGLSKQYDNDFNDIVSGSNGYSAGKGFDLATGWGSPKAGNSIVGDVR